MEKLMEKLIEVYKKTKSDMQNAYYYGGYIWDKNDEYNAYYRSYLSEVDALNKNTTSSDATNICEYEKAKRNGQKI